MTLKQAAEWFLLAESGAQLQCRPNNVTRWYDLEPTVKKVAYHIQHGFEFRVKPREWWMKLDTRTDGATRRFRQRHEAEQSAFNGILCRVEEVID